MTREEAIAFGKRVVDLGLNDETHAFCELAIQALEQKPMIVPIATIKFDEDKLKELVNKAVLTITQQDPCEDAISRQAVLDLIIHYNSDGLGSVFNDYTDGLKFANEVNKLPSVTPEPKTGHWITKPHIYGVAFCSECGFELRIDDTNFCPHCGAKMEREGKE